MSSRFQPRHLSVQSLRRKHIKRTTIFFIIIKYCGFEKQVNAQGTFYVMQINASMKCQRLLKMCHDDKMRTMFDLVFAQRRGESRAKNKRKTKIKGKNKNKSNRKKRNKCIFVTTLCLTQ